MSSGDRGGGKLGLLTVTNSPAQLQREREREGERCVGDLSEAGWAQLKAHRIIAFCETDISYLVSPSWIGWSFIFMDGDHILVQYVTAQSSFSIKK